MSCLNLKGLFPTAKVMKLFSAKISFNLHRLNRSKVIKKQKNHFQFQIDNKTTKKWPPKLANKTKRRKLIQFKARKRLDFHKKPAPVYIDQLFVEPVAVVKEHRQLPDAKKHERNSKKSECVDDHNEEEASSSGRGYEEEDHGGAAGEADDMWEAVVMASPEMHGINERAEEFISRFRAEMKRQETL